MHLNPIKSRPLSLLTRSARFRTGNMYMYSNEIENKILVPKSMIEGDSVIYSDLHSVCYILSFIQQRIC